MISVTILGGNLICMITAIKIRQMYPNAQICIAETSDSIGGNMRSEELFGDFYDIGMQNWYDTGITWVDALVREVWEGMDLAFHKWPNHDNCGLITNYGINTSSPYFNVDNDEKIENVLKFIMSEEPLLDYETMHSLEDYFRFRFGLGRNNKIVNDIIEKFSLNGEIPSHHFAKMLPLDRVLSDEISDELISVKTKLGNLVGHNQKSNINPNLESRAKYVIYPRNGGVMALVEAFKQRLLSDRIDIHTNVTLDFDSEKSLLYIFDNAGKELSSTNLVWGLNLNVLERFIDNDRIFTSAKPYPFSGNICHIKSSTPLNDRGLFYLFDYSKSPVYRLSFYGTLTNKEHDYHRATIEFIDQVNDVQGTVIDYLRHYNLIGSQDIEISPVKNLRWPLFLPVGADENISVLDEFTDNISNIKFKINSDFTKGSMLMKPTALRVLREFPKCLQIMN